MGELVWDERLMSREEFWQLASPLPLRPGIRRGLVFVDCGDCGQAVLPLGAARNPFPATCEQIAAAALRHRVSAHDMPLNHRRSDGRDNTRAAGAGDSGNPAAGPRGSVPGRVRPGAARRRPARQAAGHRGEPGTAGGDRA